MTGRRWATMAALVVAALPLAHVAPVDAEPSGSVVVDAADPTSSELSHTEPPPRRRPSKPVLGSVSPSSGSTVGGEVITIRGRHLRAVNTVKFGSVRVSEITRVGPRTLTVVAPAHSAGSVRVRIVAHGRRSTTRTYTYVEPGPPHVTRLVPATGQSGNPVEVVGSGFTGVSGVSFGGVPAMVVHVSPTLLRVAAPPHPTGPAQVQVITSRGTSAPSPAAVFTYAPPSGCYGPSVFRMYPDRGLKAGGTRVRVQGGNFFGVSSVTFGGVPGTDVVVSSGGELQVTTPPHPVGLADVKVTTACGDSLTGSEGSRFHFVAPPPTVTSISPSEQPWPAPGSGSPEPTSKRS